MILKKFNFSIIGYPLNKPRSVSLWRNFFKKKKINHKMTAIEIKPKKINLFLKNFKKDSSFIASAVTMPLKEKIFKKVNTIDKISKYAESVNLIIKQKNSIIGYNTDIYGFLKRVPKDYRNIMIMGFGGTGKAIYKVLFNLKKKTFFYIITSKYRSLKKISNNRSIFSNKIDNKILEKVDLIINCTPLGSNLKKEWIKKSPLNTAQLKMVKKKCLIYDLVYKPDRTLLSKLAKKFKLNYENGLQMNTLQAKKALDIVNENLKRNYF